MASTTLLLELARRRHVEDANRIAEYRNVSAILLGFGGTAASLGLGDIVEPARWVALIALTLMALSFLSSILLDRRVSADEIGIAIDRPELADDEVLKQVAIATLASVESNKFVLRVTTVLMLVQLCGFAVVVTMALAPL